MTEKSNSSTPSSYSGFYDSARGGAFLELAIILPIILALGLIAVEFGRYFWVRQLATTLSRQAGMAIATKCSGYALEPTLGKTTSWDPSTIRGGSLDYAHHSTETTSIGYFHCSELVNAQMRADYNPTQYHSAQLSISYIGPRELSETTILDPAYLADRRVTILPPPTPGLINLPDTFTSANRCINPDRTINTDESATAGAARSFINSLKTTETNPNAWAVEVFIPFEPILPWSELSSTLGAAFGALGTDPNGRIIIYQCALY